MPGKVQSYETTRVKKGPKNTLIGVKEAPILLWQITDRKGDVHTELGVEINPGNIMKLPSDVFKQSNPVNEKLQKLLFERLHPNLATANKDKPEAAPLGRTPKDEVASKLPKEVDVVGGLHE